MSQIPNSIKLVLSWIFIGWLATFAGLVGYLETVLSLSLFLPLYFLCLELGSLYQDFKSAWQFNRRWELVWLCLLVVSLFSHFIGVLLPETGFDALWYHLPLIEQYIDQHQLVYIPSFYQSLYPQLGDMTFVLGFQILGQLGVKLISYGVMVSLLCVIFRWAKELMSQEMAIIVVTSVSLLQVVSWQASSAYVDIYSGMLFITGCWLFLGKNRRKKFSQLFSGIVWASFLSVKFINLGFIPMLLMFFAMSRYDFQNKKWIKIDIKLSLTEIVIAIVSITLGCSWYMRAYYYTGNPLYPIGSEYAVPVIAQMERGGWLDWLWFRITTVYQLPWEFFFNNDGYVSIGLLILSPIIIFQLFKFKLSKLKVFQMLIVGIYGILFWWLFPPPSTRYIIGAVVVLILSWFAILNEWLERKPHNFKQTMVRYVMLGCILTYLLVRLVVNSQAVPYLLHQESKDQYLDGFRDGFLDEKLDRYYSTSTMLTVLV